MLCCGQGCGEGSHLFLQHLALLKPECVWLTTLWGSSSPLAFLGENPGP